MEIHDSLKTVLKRLRLSSILSSPPDRLAYSGKAKLSPHDLLEFILQDEIDRGEPKSLHLRIDKAGVEEDHTFENFDWNAPITFDRDRVKDPFGSGFIDRHEDVLVMGPGRFRFHTARR